MNQPQANRWVDAGPFDELWDGAGVELPLADRSVALFRVGSQVYATDPICTHGHARLCEGFVEGAEVECPLHQGRFDLADGRPLCEPLTEALRTYPVRIDDGRVWVDIRD